ncbi:MAG: ATP-binding cassette domain-containing protein [Thermoplasmatota archaeon]
MRDPAGRLLRVERFPTAAGEPFSLGLERGDVVLLDGPNGCGKTTLLRAIAGLPPHVATQATPLPSAGAIVASSQTQLVLQDPRDTLVGLTVAGEFRLRRSTAPESLRRFAERDVATLSSGESRKVALAAARSGAPAILLLDEPAEGLDAAAKGDLVDLVRDAAALGAVLAVDHTGTLAPLATRRVTMATTPDVALAPLPTVPGPVVLEAPAATVRRGDAHVRLPAIAIGPGFHVLRGPNGAGKSTFLLRAAGLLGGGPRVSGAASSPGQNARLLLPRARELFTRPSVRAELAGTDTLGLVPEPLMARHPLTLSGGEAQRVALAKTLGRPSAVHLLDEPEAHLDPQAMLAFWQAVTSRVAAGACILAATHDPQLQGLAHSVIEMEGE